MDTHAVPGELTSFSRFAPVTTKHIPNQAMAKTTSPDRVLPSHELKGYLLGVVGVAIFSATLPMTKLAVGSDATPLMSGEFISFARAAIAALLSLGWLAIVRPPLPRGRDWAWLSVTAFGVVLGFPLFSSMAMRYVEARTPAWYWVSCHWPPPALVRWCNDDAHPCPFGSRVWWAAPWWCGLWRDAVCPRWDQSWD